MIWAIDPFEKETKPDHSLIHKLTRWARSVNLEIQPVHVLPISEELPGDSPQEVRVFDQVIAAEKVSEAYLRNIGFYDHRPTKILAVRSPSREKEIEALLNMQKRQNPLCLLFPLTEGQECGG